MPERPLENELDEDLEKLLFAEEEGRLSPEQRERLRSRIHADPRLQRARRTYLLDGRILGAITAPEADVEQATRDLVRRIEALEESRPVGDLAARTAERLTRTGGRGASRRRAGAVLRYAGLPLGAAAAPLLSFYIFTRGAPRGLCAEVVRVRGAAELVVANRRGRLEPGEIVRPGQAIHTGAGALVRLRYPDGTAFELRGGTELLLTGKRAKHLLLEGGTIDAEVAPQPADRPMVITTPHAEATVLGTRLTLAVGPESTHLEVSEGRVRARRRSDGEAIEVTAGHYVIMAAGASLAAQPVTNKGDWPMVGGNPQRTGYTDEELHGPFKIQWVRRMPDRVPMKVQPIVAGRTLYLSTSRGLWAMDAKTGAEKWIYEPGMPMGHSPTVLGGVAYVGCYDKKVHALDAKSGKLLWTFTGGAGFATNPLVVEGRVFVGCRDGFQYALDSRTGALIWKFDAGAPVEFSSAYKDGVVHFGSLAGHAYALRASSGSLVWKSEQLPGRGMNSYWPVVAGDRVVYCTSLAYRRAAGPGPAWGVITDQAALHRHGVTAERGWRYIGKHLEGDHYDASGAIEYFKDCPWRKTVVLLDIKTGKEAETAPFLAAWTKSGTRHPPSVARDGTLYMFSLVATHREIKVGKYLEGFKFTSCGEAGVCGWKPGETTIRMGPRYASDEPVSSTIAGNYLFWTHVSNRGAGCADLRRPIAWGDGLGEWRNKRKDWRWPLGGLKLNPWCGGALPHRRMLLEAVRKKNPDLIVHWEDGGVSHGSHGDSTPPIVAGGMVYLRSTNACMIAGFAGKK